MLGSNKRASQPGALSTTTYWWSCSHCNPLPPAGGKGRGCCHSNRRHNQVDLTFCRGHPVHRGHNRRLRRNRRFGCMTEAPSVVESHCTDCTGRRRGGLPGGTVRGPPGHRARGLGGRGHCGRTLWVWRFRAGCFLPGSELVEGSRWSWCWTGRCASSCWRSSIRAGWGPPPPVCNWDTCCVIVVICWKRNQILTYASIHKRLCNIYNIEMQIFFSTRNICCHVFSVFLFLSDSDSAAHVGFFMKTHLVNSDFFVGSRTLLWISNQYTMVQCLINTDRDWWIFMISNKGLSVHSAIQKRLSSWLVTQRFPTLSQHPHRRWKQTGFRMPLLSNVWISEYWCTYESVSDYVSVWGVSPCSY